MKKPASWWAALDLIGITIAVCGGSDHGAGGISVNALEGFSTFTGASEDEAPVRGATWRPRQLRPNSDLTLVLRLRPA